MVSPVSDHPLAFDPVAEALRQWRAHGWEVPEWMAAATSIMRSQQIVLARVDGALRPLNLTFARYEALVLLSFSRQGALPMGKMGERLMVHPTSVTNAIDRLESDGFVRRTPHPQDRRTVLAEITDSGRALVANANAVLNEVQFGMGELSLPDVEALFEQLRILRSGAGDFLPVDEAT
jgi:DNA-binding MarR family transcriptional regulator